MSFSCIFVFAPSLIRMDLSIVTSDRIPSTTPGAEPPRDAKDSGSARSHSTHLETSSSDRPYMVSYTELHTVPRPNFR